MNLQPVTKKQINKSVALAIMNAQLPKAFDITSISVKVNIMHILMDLVERYNLEVLAEMKAKEIFRHDTKQRILSIQKHCRELTNSVSKSIGEYDRQCAYGDLTDYAYEFFRSAILLPDYDDQIKVIAYIRNMVHAAGQRVLNHPEHYNLTPDETHKILNHVKSKHGDH